MARGAGRGDSTESAQGSAQQESPPDLDEHDAGEFDADRSEEPEDIDPVDIEQEDISPEDIEQYWNDAASRLKDERREKSEERENREDQSPVTDNRSPITDDPHLSPLAPHSSPLTDDRTNPNKTERETGDGDGASRNPSATYYNGHPPGGPNISNSHGRAESLPPAEPAGDA